MSQHDDSNPAAKLWGGRFSEATDSFVEEFTASVGFDRRLYAQDIAGSMAHAQMLASVGVLTKQEAATIIVDMTGSALQWNNTRTYAFRAPRKQFDAWRKILASGPMTLSNIVLSLALTMSFQSPLG